jgi:hypothetical protein
VEEKEGEIIMAIDLGVSLMICTGMVTAAIPTYKFIANRRPKTPVGCTPIPRKEVEETYLRRDVYASDSRLIHEKIDNLHEKIDKLLDRS